MAIKQSKRFKVRAGFAPARIRQGRIDRYKDLSTGEEISRRQYIKRTENVKSLEHKAKSLKKWREQVGKRQPMTRYDAVVRQYKETYGKDAKVRGDSNEAKRFKKLYAELKKPRKGLKGNLTRLNVLMQLGVLTKEQYDESAEKVMAEYE